METGLQDMVALITGASGGIGRATAHAFLEEGARVALQGRTQAESMRQWVDEHGFGDRALCLTFDVRDRTATRTAFATAAEHWGRVDVCVANAGIWPPEDVPFHAMSEDRLHTTLETNLLGAAWTAQAFLAELAERGPRRDGQGAALVFTGSTAARFGERDHADYSMSKSGLQGLVRTLKNEIVRIDPYGRVNLVQPGWTVTHMARPALDDDAVVERVVKTLALRQLARARDIARTIVFLCSPRLARHVSGETVTVSGGMEGRLLWEAGDIDAAAIRARLDQD